MSLAQKLYMTQEAAEWLGFSMVVYLVAKFTQADLSLTHLPHRLDQRETDQSKRLYRLILSLVSVLLATAMTLTLRLVCQYLLAKYQPRLIMRHIHQHQHY